MLLRSLRKGPLCTLYIMCRAMFLTAGLLVTRHGKRRVSRYPEGKRQWKPVFIDTLTSLGKDGIETFSLPM